MDRLKIHSNKEITTRISMMMQWVNLFPSRIRIRYKCLILNWSLSFRRRMRSLIAWKVVLSSWRSLMLPRISLHKLKRKNLRLIRNTQTFWDKIKTESLKLNTYWILCLLICQISNASKVANKSTPVKASLPPLSTNRSTSNAPTTCQNIWVRN